MTTRISSYPTRYPTDASDGEWAFVAPSLTWMTPDPVQRTWDLRDVFNAVRWLVRTETPQV